MCFFCEFYKIFHDNFFMEHLKTTLISFEIRQKPGVFAVAYFKILQIDWTIL